MDSICSRAPSGLPSLPAFPVSKPGRKLNYSFSGRKAFRNGLFANVIQLLYTYIIYKCGVCKLFVGSFIDDDKLLERYRGRYAWEKIKLFYTLRRLEWVKASAFKAQGGLSH